MKGCLFFYFLPLSTIARGQPERNPVRDEVAVDLADNQVDPVDHGVCGTASISHPFQSIYGTFTPDTFAAARSNDSNRW
jgi:hypothetical protein